MYARSPHSKTQIEVRKDEIGQTENARRVASQSSCVFGSIYRMAVVLLIVLLLAGNFAVSVFALMRDEKRTEDRAKTEKILIRMLASICSDVNSIESDVRQLKNDVGNIESGLSTVNVKIR